MKKWRSSLRSDLNKWWEWDPFSASHQMQRMDGERHVVFRFSFSAVVKNLFFVFCFVPVEYLRAVKKFGSIQACLCNFQSPFIPLYLIFPGKLMHLPNSFPHGLSPPKSFIQKFQPDQKLWLFQNRVQVAPSTSCLPGSRGFSWDYSCFQGLYGQNSKAIRSIKAKQSGRSTP